MNGEQIRAARQLLGKDQSDFGKHILRCQKYRVTRLENGHAEIRPLEVEAIRRALEAAAANTETEVRQRQASIHQVLQAVAVA